MGSRERARGFGISATRDLRQACEIARAVQGLGYRTVWTNDLPGADGLVVAKAMADATSTIRIGVGAVPCDRRAPSELASRLSSLSIPPDRLALIVGAGFSARPLEAVADALAHLRDRNGDALTLGVAAMGPRMCRLGGRLGDVVLLNWMTPERLAWAREKIDQGARARPPDLPPVEVAAYVRAAIGPGASHLIAEEAGRYASTPHYRRHFDAMGAEPARVGVAFDEAGPEQFRRYDQLLDETVVRALVASRPTAKDLLEVARATTPQPT